MELSPLPKTSIIHHRFEAIFHQIRSKFNFLDQSFVKLDALNLRLSIFVIWYESRRELIESLCGEMFLRTIPYITRS